MTENRSAPPFLRQLTVLTYNVHSCRGMDGRTDPARIAEVIARCAPDIAALQEVDVGRTRSGGADQAELIAAHLGMRSHFHPALHLESEQYGDAILTSLPTRLMRAGPLPSRGEPRGALWLAVDLDGTELHVINTHLGLGRRERRQQIDVLSGPDWLGSPACRWAPTIFLGDFNAVPGSAVYRRIRRDWRDVQVDAGRRPRATFPSRLPLLRIDHIFVGAGIAVSDATVHMDPTARLASDHLPLTAKLSVPILEPTPIPASAARWTRRWRGP